MNRETRDKFASRTDQADLTTGNACWETAPAVFAKIAEDFGPFDLDLCADLTRRLCPAFFGPGSPLHTDALTAPWSQHGRCGFFNPPYGPFVPKMLAKAVREAALGFTSVGLLPMRATKAFHRDVLGAAAALRFCDRRLVFFEHGVPRLNAALWMKKGQAVADSAMFDSILVVFAPGRRSIDVASWAVPVHVSRDDLDRAIARRKAVA